MLKLHIFHSVIMHLLPLIALLCAFRNTSQFTRQCLVNILPQNGRQCLPNFQIAVYQRHLSEILKISKRQTFMSCVLQTICQGFPRTFPPYSARSFAALFEFDDIGADQPVAPVQHLVDGQSGPGLCSCKWDTVKKLNIIYQPILIFPGNGFSSFNRIPNPGDTHFKLPRLNPSMTSPTL